MIYRLVIAMALAVILVVTSRNYALIIVFYFNACTLVLILVIDFALRA